MSKHIGRDRRRTPKPRRASKPATTAALQRAGESISGEGGSSRSAIARLLDSPHLARVVPQLAPEALHQLIRHYGIDVCAEIVAAATPRQLASVFDLDLWRSAQPGRDEHFDTARFGEWVELLVDAGASVAARTISAMDADLVVAGLSRYIRVFDPAALVPFIEGEPVEIEATPHRGPESEVGGYLVRGITAEAWDAIIALLLALESDHPDRFHAVMGECRRLSNSAPEVDGLDDLLKEPEQLLNDVALDRERRRSQQGYSTPADARAFLLVARRRNRPSNGEPPVNPLVAAYFRAFTDTIGPENDAAPNARRVLEPPSAPEGVPEALDAVVDLLAQSGLISQRPRALLEATHAQPSRFARLRSLMEFARESDDAMYVLRSHELAFLANTLVAGCSIQSRSFTPQEASDAAAGICNLGLEHWPALWPVSHAASKADLGVALPDTFLKDHDLVSAFEVGWGVLHENVSMFVAGQLLSSLSDLRFSDADIQKGMNALRSALTRQREEATPWLAREALDVMAMLDMPAWVSVVGLLDECPVIPAALTATLEGRTGAISPTEFEFISTKSQLARVRQFMARFPDILLR